MNVLTLISALLVALLTIGTADAQLLTHPAATAGPGTNQYGVYLGKSSTEYDIEKSDDSGEIDRSFLAAYMARGINDIFDVYAGAAYGFDIEDGSGYQLGLGLKGKLEFIDIRSFDFNWYSQLSVFSEELDEVDEITVENTLSEWLLGLVAVKPIDPDLKLYAGLEFVASSIGEAVSKKSGLDDFKSDFERNDRVGLRLGLEYRQFQLHIGAVNESSVMFGVSLPFGTGPETPKKPQQTLPPKDPAKSEAPVTPEVRKIELDLYEDTKPISEREKIRRLQQKLKDLGYNPGPVDGFMGKRTAAAIRKFQKDQSLPVKGQADSATYKALGLE